MRHTKAPGCACAKCERARYEAHMRSVAPTFFNELVALIGPTIQLIEREDFVVTYTMDVEFILNVDWSTNNFVGSKRRAIRDLCEKHGVKYSSRKP